MNLTDAKDFATVLGVGVALFALVKGVIEYIHQGTQTRAVRFIELEQKFLENSEFRTICSLLEHDDESLATLPYESKLHFLGFIEQIALLLNSKLVSIQIVHYTYGYYTTRCLDSTQFWIGLDKDSPYWSLFIAFANRLKAQEKKGFSKVSRLRF